MARARLAPLLNHRLSRRGDLRLSLLLELSLIIGCGFNEDEVCTDVF